MPAPPPAADGSCTLFRCICCWRRACSPRIPRVAPGRDYVCMPAGADDRPAWSLLVGFLADSGLRLHRFRVAPSGRILGRSNDALEIFHRVEIDDFATAPICGAEATLSPDGRSLCIFHGDRPVDAKSTVVPVRVLNLLLDDDDEKRTTTQLPTLLLGRLMPCRPVTAAGGIWAPYLQLLLPGSSCLLGMQRLDKNHGRWVEVGTTIEFPYEMEVPMKWGGSIFQGLAVVQDTILVSLRPAHLFFSFNCSTCAWTAITTNTNTSAGNTTSSKDDTSTGNPMFLSFGTTVGNGSYVPIGGRGVYVEEDDAIYFLQNSAVFAYKLHGRDQQPLVELKPPTKIDSVSPFHDDGFGLLTHLGGRLMCSVWISVACCDCPCDKYHVIISTFRVRFGSDDIPNGIEILHSTCRQLDTLSCIPIVPTDEFCFLQEYEEYNNHDNAMAPLMLLEAGTEDPTSPYAEDSSEMLDCCRKFLSEPPYPRCYVLQKPVFQITTDLYLVCQAGSRLIVYWTKIVAGRLMSDCSYSPLRVHADMNTVIGDSDCHAMKQPSQRYFVVRNLTSMYAVSYKPDDSCEFEIGRPSSSNLLKTSRPAGVCFAMVLNVGLRIVAVSHALEVFLFVPPRSRFYGNRPTPGDCWKHCKTGRPDLGLNRRVELSGYVVLDADTFIVSDKETCRCFLLNLKVKQWEVVLPDDKSRTLQFHDPFVYGRQRLTGRSIYVGGYVYSSAPGGLVAYDFGDGLLDDRICLPFSWRKKAWERERMCLELVGAVGGALLFCVVQGEFLNRPGGQNACVYHHCPS